MGAAAGALERAGRYPEAEAVLRKVLAAHPQHAAANYALGILLLRQGRYAEGWPHYDYRHQLTGGTRKPQLSFPEWKGEAVSSLVLLPEQGFGDQIMMARYVPLLRARGISVTVVCPLDLVRLLTPLGAPIIPIGTEVRIPRHDAWAMLGALPWRLGTIPAEPYLPGRAGGQGVGVVTRGRTNAEPPQGHERLLALPGAVSLQPQDSGAKDFEDTAEIIRGLELVISVDTATAHLAGAMGKPTWLILPLLGDWRWGPGETNAWYPSMRQYRQAKPGGWTEVIDRIVRDRAGH